MSYPGVIEIARKEFFDHVRSRKFLLIFGIFLMVAIIGLVGGISDYNDILTAYNEDQTVIIGVGDLKTETILMPSVLLVFNSMTTPFYMIGVILAIAMGFDLISKERENKSLKILLAHPVYRDEVINGKALGAIAALLLAFAVVLVISFATLLVFSIVPNPTEILMIVLFCGFSFLFIFSYFAVALCMSAITEDSGKALIYTMVIYTIFSGLISIVMMTPAVTDIVVGSQPEMPEILRDQSIQSEAVAEELEQYQQDIREYSERRMAFTQTLSFFSPRGNYQKITTSLTNPAAAGLMYGQAIGDAGNAETGVDIPGLLSGLFVNIIALILIPVIFFGIAYVKFMRIDVR